MKNSDVIDMKIEGVVHGELEGIITGVLLLL